MKKSIFLTIVFILFFSLFIFLLYKVSNYTTICIEAEDFTDKNIAFTQNNEKTIFSINKITYFSGCNANIESNSNSSFTISDLYQYTDIALFINPNSEILTAENTLKSVKITDFEYNKKPNIGIQNLYYKNINNFATPNYLNDNLIKDYIYFETTSENSIDYSAPILYNNCANPITLSYVNSNILDKYTLNNNISNISNNGSLLKSCGITLNSISTEISFVITITNNQDEVFNCPLTLNIPLSTENSTLYDGSLTLKDSTKYNFIKQLKGDN